jgi:predicted RNase H-like nuclease (RuvC/YqgF family)
MAMSVLAGCAANKEEPTVFWNKKDDGTVIVHHVVGTKDHVEKLTKKQDETLDGKYFKVAEVDSTFTVAKKKEKPQDEKVDTGRLENKIAALKREIEAVAAHNQELENRLSQQPAPVAAAVVPEVPEYRESQ